MPLETATYISDLNVANPAHTDGLSQADSQMRLLKSTIKATFPNFTAAALVSTQSQIDTAVAGALLTLLRSGTVPPGMIDDFGGATAPTGWLACDGQAVSRVTYVDLFTAIGTTWGAGDGSTTFNVPAAPNRFRRHRAVGSLAGAVGTLQTSVNLTHTHGVTGTTDGGDVPDHLHVLGGITGDDTPDHNHGYTAGGLNGVTYAPNAGSQQGSSPVASTSGGANQRHHHSLPLTTGARDRSLVHSHTLGSMAITATGDANEARPYSMSVLTCIKT